MIFTGLIIYLLYKFVVDLVMPVSKATSQMKNKITDFQRMQQEEMRRQQAAAQSHNTQQAPKASARPSNDDYIDFEEVK